MKKQQILGFRHVVCTLGIAVLAQFATLSYAQTEMPKTSEDKKTQPAAVAPPEHSKAPKPEGIEFVHDSVATVIEKAKLEKKIIFVDAYTTWCGPCKKLASEVFPQPQVGDFFNANFINLKLDMEKGEGPEFAKKYNIRSYPTLLFLDAEGKELNRVVGFRTAEALLKEARKSLVNDEQIALLKKEYESGSRDKAFMAKYVRALQTVDDASLPRISGDWVGMLSPSDLQDRETLRLLYDISNRITSKSFDFLLQHREKFEAEYGADKVARKIVKSAEETLPIAIKNKDTGLLKEINNVLLKSGSDNSKELACKAQLNYYSNIENWKTYTKIATDYLDQNDVQDHNMLNTIAWQFFLHVDNAKQLAKAESWAAKSVALKGEYANNDTYAAILYKLGKKADALVAAEKAISIAKLEKKDYKSTQQLIDKIIAD